MINPIRIVITTEPVPKDRPHTKFINGQAITYTSTRTRNAESFIKARLYRYRERAFPEHTPLKLTCTFFRRKGKWIKKKETIPCRKPDLVNFEALLCDAMNEMLYADDAQISTIIAKKRWSNDGEGHITLKLEEDKL